MYDPASLLDSLHRGWRPPDHAPDYTEGVNPKQHREESPMLIPVGRRILIDPIPPKETSEGGILLPEQSSAGNPSEGRVVAVGMEIQNYVEQNKAPAAHDAFIRGREPDAPRWPTIPITIQEGDTALYWPNGVQPILEGGHKYILLEEHQVLAVRRITQAENEERVLAESVRAGYIGSYDARPDNDPAAKYEARPPLPDFGVERRIG